MGDWISSHRVGGVVENLGYRAKQLQESCALWAFEADRYSARPCERKQVKLLPRSKDWWWCGGMSQAATGELAEKEYGVQGQTAPGHLGLWRCGGLG